MSKFEPGRPQAGGIDAATLLLAPVGALVSFGIMTAYLESERGGLAWVWLNYALNMGLPAAFGLAAWYFGSLRGLLLVSGLCSLAIGTAGYFNLRQILDDFSGYSTSFYVTSVLIGYLAAVAVGMLMPLLFAVYQLWPVGESPPANDALDHTVRTHQKAVDNRFGPG